MQDYSLAIRSGTFETTLNLLRLLLVLFSLLYKPVYLRAIGYHLLLMEYHQGSKTSFFILVEIGHPCIEMQTQNFPNMNGEDIELASRELSQSQLSSRGRDEVNSFSLNSFSDRSRG